MLSVENLTVSFGPTTAVRDVGLTAAPGAVTGILGANGAGKTTTLLGIHGCVPRTTGTIRLDGEDVTAYDTRRLVAAGIALCPENRRLFPNMSIEDNLLLGAHGTGRGGRKARLERVYDRFDWIRRRRGEPAGRLSGGQQQSVAIARALMSGPKVVLLDEPSSGLSPVAVEEVGALLRDIADQGTAILLVEQNVGLVRDLCTNAWVLAHGEVTASGPVAGLLATDEISNAYLGGAATPT